jgi:GNAT superfamily N-acetyltransferase
VKVLKCTEARISDLARVSYSFDRKREQGEPGDDISVRRVDTQTFDGIRRDLDPEFPTECPLPIHGMAIRHKDRYVSCAWGPAAGGIVEIAVITHPEFQGRGLAKVAAMQLIDDLLSVGLTPHASTNATNEPARRWAESVGFSRPIHHHWAVLAAKAKD